jgi:DNA-binding transcriptional LysR family regulator
VSFPADSRTRALIARTLRGSGVDFAVVAESSQPAVLREMVHLGMGWTALTAVDAEREPHALRRARPGPIVERVLSLSHRVDRTMSPSLRHLIDALVVAAGVDAETTT